MGRGKDLTINERTIVHIKKHWNYDENQFEHKGWSLMLKECEEYGVRLSKLTTIPEMSLKVLGGTPIDIRLDFEDYDRCVDLLHADYSIDLVRSYT